MLPVRASTMRATPPSGSVCSRNLPPGVTPNAGSEHGLSRRRTVGPGRAALAQHEVGLCLGVGDHIRANRRSTCGGVSSPPAVSRWLQAGTFQFRSPTVGRRPLRGHWSRADGAEPVRAEGRGQGICPGLCRDSCKARPGPAARDPRPGPRPDPAQGKAPGREKCRARDPRQGRWQGRSPDRSEGRSQGLSKPISEEPWQGRARRPAEPPGGREGCFSGPAYNSP
jgi:hypothetical protein